MENQTNQYTKTFREKAEVLYNVKQDLYGNQIYFNLNEMGNSDIYSMHLIIDAWSELSHNDKDIFTTGFNKLTGYVYIALDNGISICSNFGQDVEYLVTDFATGEEYFFDKYDEAAEKLLTL